MKRYVMIVLALLTILIASFTFFSVDVPRTWDMTSIKKFHLPPADTTVSVQYPSEEYYYSLEEHKIYKSFPVYLKEFEKPGYLDSLRSLKAEIVFDETKLKTQDDWIKAGEVVFNWPVASYRAIESKVSHLDTNYFKNSNARITIDGVYGFQRYFINGEGKLMIGSLSCASCHTRVLQSGDVVPGGQGNVFDNTGFANAVESGKIPFQVIQTSTHKLHFSPWAPKNLKSQPADAKEFARYIRGNSNGIIDRQGTLYEYPAVVPGLIGIKDIKYLDRTGIMRHDGSGDMMRYAAFNQGMDLFVSYNQFIPGGKNNYTQLPSASEWSHPFGYVSKRYSDAQLYALTQYIYSLQPPKNPNRFSKAILAKGSLVFKREGCVTCHTPPLYTNNKLTPANGFVPPKDHFNKYDIFNISVETDSVSALYSRRGTGYYKVPSLRGVWYQGAFFHNGSLLSLEEVFNPARTRSDYLSTSNGSKGRPVKGHPFGLTLSKPDKEALIAFLKTL